MQYTHLLAKITHIYNYNLDNYFEKSVTDIYLCRVLPYVSITVYEMYSHPLCKSQVAQ